VDSVLEDMPGLTFVRIAVDRWRTGINIVVATPDRSKDSLLDAVASGCSGYILRPYSLNTFEAYMNRIVQVSRSFEIERELLSESWVHLKAGDAGEAISGLEEIVATPNDAYAHFFLGTQLLLKKKYGQAIIAFQKAVRANDLYAEAFKGLGEAYRQKGEHERARGYLDKAAELFALQNRLQESKELFIEILKMSPSVRNPYNTLGIRLRQRGHCGCAVEAYLRAIELSPTDENLFYNIAKAYQFMGNQERAKHYIKRALHLNSSFKEAKAFYAHLTGSEWITLASAVRAEPAYERSFHLDLN
jgi:tetratricopeptide (TPR) repeat protein